MEYIAYPPSAALSPVVHRPQPVLVCLSWNLVNRIKHERKSAHESPLGLGGNVTVLETFSLSYLPALFKEELKE